MNILSRERVQCALLEPDLHNRCKIAECDSPDSPYDAPWTEYSIPWNGKDMDKCNRYENNKLSNWTQSEDICLADNYNNAKIQSCPGNEFVFRDDEVTISNEVSTKVLISFAIKHVN